MKRYPRALRRFKNPYRGVRRTGFRRNRFRRSLVNRFLRRRPVRPEVKFVENNNLRTGMTALRQTLNITPPNIINGNLRYQKIGDSCNFRKIFCYLEILSGTQLANKITDQSQYSIRFIFWTPRVDFTIADTYMKTALGITQVPNFNTVTVHRDFVTTMTYRMSNTLTDNTLARTGFQLAANGTTKWIKKFVFKFPRKAKFAEADNTLVNPDKDMMYMTAITDANAFGNDATHTAPQVGTRSTLYFTDS